MRAGDHTRLNFMSLLLVLSGSACGDDGGEAPPPVSTAASDASVLASSDAGAPLNPGNSAQDGGFIGAAPDAAGPGVITLGGDASTAQDAASKPDAQGPIVITIPTRSVTCGVSECTTTNNRTCCEAWSKEGGFTGSPSCSTQAACTSDHSTFGDSNRAVMSDCDEPSDCSGGQVCCFVRYGAPTTADLLSTEIIGPGASRLCLELSKCNAGMTSFSGVAGIPLGLVACRNNSHCTDGATCMPEPDNSATTGKTSRGRPGVSVCR